MAADQSEIDEPPAPPSSSPGSPKSRLYLKVNDRPAWKEALLFGFQQATVCMSSMLVVPFLVSHLACAGEGMIALRVQLISATFVASGIATLLQTTLGLRLSILNGPAFCFLPPLLAFFRLPENRCDAPTNGVDPQEHLYGKIQTVSGSLVIACLTFVLIGSTGAVGVFSKHVGPVTVVPLLVLLALSTVSTLDEKLSLHWISIVMVIVLIIVVIYCDDVHVPIPCGIRPLRTKPVRIFGQFPYLISVCIVWFICFLLTASGLEPEEGQSRTDKAATQRVLAESPWVQVPYPGLFGWPRIDIGLTVAFVASTFSSVMENLGSYAMAARVSEQAPAPRSTVNRAIIVEGLGSIVAALFGVCSGVTTYNENIALIPITRVASRVTMQIAGCMLIVLGLFTKAGAVLASIPDPVLGGVLLMGMSMIGGVAMSQLQLIDLKLTRNIAIIGMSLLLGMVIPTHFDRVPLNMGIPVLDGTLNMLLTIKMLIGGGIALVLDNTVPGATRAQRGLNEHELREGEQFTATDGYAFSDGVNRLFHRVPALTRLPFVPSKKNLNRIAPAASDLPN